MARRRNNDFDDSNQTYAPQPERTATPTSDRLTGTIARLIADRGFCFIKTSQGQDYFCHMSALPPGDFNELKVGDRVSFESEPSDKGPRAARVERL